EKWKFGVDKSDKSSPSKCLCVRWQRWCKAGLAAGLLDSTVVAHDETAPKGPYQSDAGQTKQT
ncbi:MAG: hypothetical protein ACJARI_001843, partial [Bacteroidia bacterium]